MEKGLGTDAPRPFKKRKKVSLRPALPPKRTGLTHCPKALLPRNLFGFKCAGFADTCLEAGAGFIHFLTPLLAWVYSYEFKLGGLREAGAYIRNQNSVWEGDRPNPNLILKSFLLLPKIMPLLQQCYSLPDFFSVC